MRCAFSVRSERRDRREQPLLQSDEGELGQRRLVRRKRGDAATAQLAVGGEAAPEVELGSVRGQACDADGLDLSLREGLAEAAQVGLQTADHHRLEIARA